MPSDKRVKRWTLAQLGVDLRTIVGEKLRKLLPNAGEFRIVTRKGRAEVQVKIKTGDES